MLIILRVILFVLLSVGSSLAAMENSVELRAAAFLPSASLFRNIYGQTGVDYELEYGLRWASPWGAWANLAWYPKQGHSIGLDCSTRINLLNFSSGIRGYYDFNPNVAGYAGIGPSLTGVWIKNEGFCGHERASKLVFGGIVKVGVYANIYKALFVDLFVDYLYAPATFESYVNLGGLKAGVGLGFRI